MSVEWKATLVTLVAATVAVAMIWAFRAGYGDLAACILMGAIVLAFIWGFTYSVFAETEAATSRARDVTGDGKKKD